MGIKLGIGRRKGRKQRKRAGNSVPGKAPRVRIQENYERSTGLKRRAFVTLKIHFQSLSGESFMADAALSGTEFKKQLRAGTPKVGLFLNSHSSTIAEQLAHSGYDWLLVDTQHGPMNHENLSAMLQRHLQRRGEVLGPRWRI
jgi:hypothetical protein